MKTSTTIGYERAHNGLLNVADEDEFVARAIGALGPQPPNFEAIVAINRGPLSHGGSDANPLTPRQVEAARDAGALLVDVRTDLQFDEAHVPGAVCNPAVRAGFGTKLAWIADRDQAIVLIGRDDQDAHRAAALASAVAITRIAGFLAGGMTSWREERRPTTSVERIDVGELHHRTAIGAPIQILDVRERTEWETGHIPGSLNVPYHELHELPSGLDPADPGRPVAAICGSGQRSAVAASLLLRLGVPNVIHVAPGGVGDWAAAGGTIEQEAEPAPEL